ncbi:carboxymuconolactone decarboxylase family protein [Acuticoccus kandeliae]|uniref:carboxymuconolactone decarboxylase family protein n=1 Tax=Acuticoccus kandeliae TaxID=2073160 RepID=UPI000D3ECD01|nr:4-carboxymuconolactone decarboxylase [Acuticoccus kandeliae]
MRVSDLDPERLDADQQRVYDAIAAGPRATVPAPLRIWLHSPHLAEHAQSLGAFCRYGTTLPPHLSELAILVMGAHWRANYEWQVHAPIAEASGVAPEIVEAIRAGVRPKIADLKAAAVYEFSQELLSRRAVSEATMALAKRELGERGVVELVGILGYYTLISMTIVAFEVPPIPGDVPFPKD